MTTTPLLEELEMVLVVVDDETPACIWCGAKTGTDDVERPHAANCVFLKIMRRLQEAIRK